MCYYIIMYTGIVKDVKKKNPAGKQLAYHCDLAFSQES